MQTRFSGNRRAFKLSFCSDRVLESCDDSSSPDRGKHRVQLSAPGMSLGDQHCLLQESGLGGGQALELSVLQLKKLDAWPGPHRAGLTSPSFLP